MYAGDKTFGVGETVTLGDVVIPIVTSGIALAIMWSYEISETRANDIRAQLEQRRGRLTEASG